MASTGKNAREILTLRLNIANQFGNLGVYGSVILKRDFTPQNVTMRGAQIGFLKNNLPRWSTLLFSVHSQTFHTIPSFTYLKNVLHLQPKKIGQKINFKDVYYCIMFKA